MSSKGYKNTVQIKEED